MKRAVLLIVVVLVAVAAIFVWHHRPAAAESGVRIGVRGGDGGGLPLAQPVDEHMAAPALERIAQDPAAEDLQALLIMRHGHLVFSRYGRGTDANTIIDSGGFARALISLAAGAAADHRLIDPPPVFQPDVLRRLVENASHQPYAEFLGNRIWARVNAAPAWIVAPSATAPVPADCCFHARVLDWLRIGGLLADEGSFEDTAIVSRSWAQRMRQPQASGAAGYGIALPSSRPGAPTYEAPDLFLLRGPARWRIWVVPSLHLVVLYGAPADAGNWDESRVPDLVIDAVLDRPPAPASSLLQQLVHGH